MDTLIKYITRGCLAFTLIAQASTVFGESLRLVTNWGTGSYSVSRTIEFAEEINVLRNWRDDYLLKNRLGTIFVHSYYRLSPPLADNIRRSDTKRSWTRKLLAPFIKILSGKYK